MPVAPLPSLSPNALVTRSLWPATVLLIFWSVIAGVVLAQWLPHPARPQGFLLWALSGLVMLGIGRAVAALRRAARTPAAPAAPADVEPPSTPRSGAS